MLFVQAAGRKNGAPYDDITVAQIAVLMDEGTSREKFQIFYVPLRKPGELTLADSGFKLILAY